MSQYVWARVVVYFLSKYIPKGYEDITKRNQAYVLVRDLLADKVSQFEVIATGPRSSCVWSGIKTL